MRLRGIVHPMTQRGPTLLFFSPVPMAEIWTKPIGMLMPELAVRVHAGEMKPTKGIRYVLGFRPPPGALAMLPDLKCVFSFGAGVDSILADPSYPKHVPLVRFADETLARDMAQYCVLHTLIHYRRQRELDAQQRSKVWRWVVPKHGEGIRVGVLGLGVIGRMTAERLRDLGFAVAGWSRTPKKIPGIESFAGRDSLDAFLARTDIAICLLPLTPETEHVLDARAFALLPEGAVVINAARGKHLVERDLIAALDAGHLKAATLDVFETEPLPVDNPLWTHPKVTVTPHGAGLSDPNAVARSVVDNIRRVERGEKPPHQVDFARGY